MPAFDLSPYYVIFFVVFLVICFFIYMNIILAVIYNNYRKHLKVCVACFLIITHCCFCTKYPFIYLFFLIFIYFPSQCHSLVYFMKKCRHIFVVVSTRYLNFSITTWRALLCTIWTLQLVVPSSTTII